jgi:hypothetical protein
VVSAQSSGLKSKKKSSKMLPGQPTNAKQSDMIIETQEKIALAQI